MNFWFLTERSIGANKVQMACIPFRTSCQDKNIEGSVVYLFINY